MKKKAELLSLGSPASAYKPKLQYYRSLAMMVLLIIS